MFSVVGRSEPHKANEPAIDEAKTKELDIEPNQSSALLDFIGLVVLNEALFLLTIPCLYLTMSLYDRHCLTCDIRIDIRFCGT